VAALDDFDDAAQHYSAMFGRMGLNFNDLAFLPRAAKLSISQQNCMDPAEW
jgi:hypothetical protein